MRYPMLLSLALLCVLSVSAAAGEELELIDGTTIPCIIEEVKQDVVKVKAKPGDLMLTVPRKYLSVYQDYELRMWRLRSKDGPDAKDASVQMDYGQWCLERHEQDARLLDRAKHHLDEAKKLDSGLAEDIRLLLETRGYYENPQDASRPWVTEDEWHRLQGHVKDPETGNWYTKEKMKEIEQERERNIKVRLLGSTKTVEYAFATAGLIRGSLADYNEKKVHLWGRVVEVRKEFAPETLGGVKFAPPKYVRVLLEAQDCPSVYFPLTRPDLEKKVMRFKPGDRVVVYGVVRIGASWFALDAVDIVQK